MDVAGVVLYEKASLSSSNHKTESLQYSDVKYHIISGVFVRLIEANTVCEG